ncbi:MAG: PH domain-containing protein [Gammaproteobacteria bacterium]
MTVERPLPALLTVWRIRHLAWVAGGALLVFLLALPLWDILGGLTLSAAARRAALVALALALPAALLVAWHARLALARFEWSHLPGEGVVVRSGAWWHKEIWLPVARLQHLDVLRGPLERRHGLATLALFTAGFQQYLVKLQGLDPERALALRDALLEEIRAHRTPPSRP